MLSCFSFAPQGYWMVSLNTGSRQVVHEVRGWKRWALVLLALLVRAWLYTLRMRVSEEDAGRIRGSGEARMFLIWHNQLLVTPLIHWRLLTGRRVAGLISASKDGALLAEFFRLLDIEAVRGSSSRLGREALHSLVSLLREGLDVAITPDGPRGPVYELEEGALVAARRARVPLLLLGCTFRTAIRINSWDGFFIPLPFSRVDLKSDRIELCELEKRGEAALMVESRLRSIGALNETFHRAKTRMRLPDGIGGLNT